MHTRGSYSHSNGTNARNLLIFGCDLPSSIHENNRAISVLVLDKGLIQKTNNYRLYAEEPLKTNCTAPNKTFVLILHYNSSNSYLYYNGMQQVRSTANNNLIPYPLCVGNISKDFSSTDSQKTGLYGNVYYFSVSYDSISTDKIQNIHTYLTNRHNI